LVCNQLKWPATTGWANFSSRLRRSEHRGVEELVEMVSNKFKLVSNKLNGQQQEGGLTSRRASGARSIVGSRTRWNGQQQLELVSNKRVG
jgi:hypothetical protein